MTKIVLVEDRRALCHALRTGLVPIPELDVIGEAGDGAEALLHTRELQPDLVVMDAHMPGVDGITATRYIPDEIPNSAVIASSFL